MEQEGRIVERSCRMYLAMLDFGVRRVFSGG
jgi:hypothetical protein